MHGRGAYHAHARGNFFVQGQIDPGIILQPRGLGMSAEYRDFVSPTP